MYLARHEAYAKPQVPIPEHVAAVDDWACRARRAGNPISAVWITWVDYRSRIRSIPELDHERVPIEQGLNETALHAPAPAVDQADLAQPGLVGGSHVLVDDGLDVGGRERVQVEHVFDRHAYGIGFVVGHGFW